MKHRVLDSRSSRASGFSLFEVVLAVGVLSISILALLGLFGPTMSSVRDVVDSNEANSVRTRLNSAFMSDEIYKAFGTDQADGRFETFAGQLNDPTASNRAPLFIYFWNERDDLNDNDEIYDPVVLNYSVNPKTDTATARQMDLTKVEGSAFVVALEQGMQGGSQPYDFSDPDFVKEQGHFPILVSIYSVAPTDLLNKNAADFTDMVNKVDPVFSYTTAKLR